MAKKYCGLCKRNVETKRQIGVGTLILAICTAGFWILLIPFYSKRCSLCKSKEIYKFKRNIQKEGTTCPYCDEVIKPKAIVCKHCGRDIEILAEKPNKSPSMLISTDDYLSMDEFCETKGLNEDDVLRMISNDSLKGRLVDGEWFIYKHSVSS